MKRLCWLLPWLFAGISSAQVQTSGRSSPQAGQSQSPPKALPQSTDSANRAAESAKATSKDRLFFTLPNFLTLENAANAPPLTTAQKFAVTARGSFDPVELASFGVLAGIAQAENGEPSYGQGAEGYAKRYGLRFGDGVIENFMTRLSSRRSCTRTRAITSWGKAASGGGSATR